MKLIAFSDSFHYLVKFTSTENSPKSLLFSPHQILIHAQVSEWEAQLPYNLHGEAPLGSPESSDAGGGNVRDVGGVKRGRDDNASKQERGDKKQRRK